MAKSDPTKTPELLPDAWERFERAVEVVGKSPPQHRKANKKRYGDIAKKKESDFKSFQRKGGRRPPEVS